MDGKPNNSMSYFQFILFKSYCAATREVIRFQQCLTTQSGIKTHNYSNLDMTRIKGALKIWKLFKNKLDKKVLADDPWLDIPLLTPMHKRPKTPTAPNHIQVKKGTDRGRGGRGRGNSYEDANTNWKENEQLKQDQTKKQASFTTDNEKQGCISAAKGSCVKLEKAGITTKYCAGYICDGLDCCQEYDSEIKTCKWRRHCKFYNITDNKKICYAN